MELTGGCLCGAIRYAVTDAPEIIVNCHCSMCRRHHGAAYGTYAFYLNERFRLVSGAEHLKNYASSPATTRQFCEICGSSLFFLDDAFPDHVAVAIGGLEGDPGKRPELHIYVDSKAVWHEITDDIPVIRDSPGSDFV